MSRPCTVRHVEHSGSDEMGEPSRSVTTTDTVCELQQSTTSEQRDGGVVVVGQWNLYLPPGVAIDSGDEVAVDGHLFAVDGAPWVARDALTGVDDHVEVRLREVS